jgi:hypothetical protein
MARYPNTAIPAFVHGGWVIANQDAGFVLEHPRYGVATPAHHLGNFIDGVRELGREIGTNILDAQNGL